MLARGTARILGLAGQRHGTHVSVLLMLARSTARIPVTLNECENFECGMRISMRAAPLASTTKTENQYRFFPDMPGMRRVYRVNKASVHGSAARNEQRPWSRG